MRRRDLVLLLGGSIVAARPLRAQQRKPIPVIGFLHSGAPGSAAANVAAFRQALSDNGYVAGKNVEIEYRWAEGQFDRLPGFAVELVSRKVDVIVAAGGTPPILAAKAATSTIPIVFANAGNPVDTGLVASLARPGGNLTGVSILFAELTLKRIELLSELVPQARLIASLVNPRNPTNEITVGEQEEAARIKGVQLRILRASSEGEIETAFALLAQQQADALIVSPDVLFITRRQQVLGLVTRAAVPAMYGWRDFVENGGLMSYSPNMIGAYRQTALYVAKILNGAKPADLPVEQPTKFELVINLKTAKTLGITVPPTILARADEVIE
jgi:putative tryptophan/tyrosine transport system substrate-binding protein